MNKLRRGDGVFAILMFVIGICVAISIVKLQNKVRESIAVVIGKTGIILFCFISSLAFSAETDAVKATKKNFFESGYTQDLSSVSQKDSKVVVSTKTGDIKSKTRIKDVKKIQLIDLNKLRQSIVELVEKYDLKLSVKGNILSKGTYDLYGHSKIYLKTIELQPYHRFNSFKFLVLKKVGRLNRLSQNNKIQPIDGGKQLPLVINSFQGGIY